MSETITGDSPMQAVLQVFPGAQRALFRKYHIGGCSSCGFQPEETLAGVCERNGDLPVADVLEQIRQSHEEDARVLIEPADLAKRREDGDDVEWHYGCDLAIYCRYAQWLSVQFHRLQQTVATKRHS